MNFTIIFSRQDTENNFEEIGWSVCKTWKDHSSKTRVILCFDAFGEDIMILVFWIEKKALVNLGQSLQNKMQTLIKELVYSQEEGPHTYLAPHKIAEQTRISS